MHLNNAQGGSVFSWDSLEAKPVVRQIPPGAQFPDPLTQEECKVPAHQKMENKKGRLTRQFLQGRSR